MSYVDSTLPHEGSEPLSVPDTCVRQSDRKVHVTVTQSAAPFADQKHYAMHQHPQLTSGRRHVSTYCHAHVAARSSVKDEGWRVGLSDNALVLKYIGPAASSAYANEQNGPQNVSHDYSYFRRCCRRGSSSGRCLR